MKTRLSLLCAFLIALTPLFADINKNKISRNFYIDAVNGSDLNDGLSPKKALKSIKKINSIEFGPGDNLLFKSGCKWDGQLRPKGSGVKDSPITINKYGKGALPIINQGELKGSVILLHNQDYWEISNIEIDGGTNKPNDQVAGIFVEATTAQRVLNHIIIKDCTIRNTLGSIKLYESSAVWVGVPGWDNKNGLTTSFNNVVIENNKIYNSVRNGILVWTCAGPGKESQFQKGLISSKNVIIRKNHLENIGGDAILVLGSDKPLIEYNTVEHCCTQSGDPKFGKDYNPSSAAIWLHHCENGLMQFNIVINCEKLENNNDGMAYDFDFNCNGNILQYNFSYNNKGGFLLIMPTATNNIARYNVSHNDLSHVLFCVGNKDENNLVYNNTFYNELGESFIVANSIFYNNIFVALKDAKISVQNPESGIFDSNCYFGNWGTKPKDDNALNEDPLLKPVNAKYGHWHLKKDSPCKQNGKLIPNNGGRDIFGKKISNTKKPSIGACE